MIQISFSSLLSGPGWLRWRAKTVPWFRASALHPDLVGTKFWSHPLGNMFASNFFLVSWARKLTWQGGGQERNRLMKSSVTYAVGAQ